MFFNFCCVSKYVKKNTEKNNQISALTLNTQDHDVYSKIKKLIIFTLYFWKIYTFSKVVHVTLLVFSILNILY